MNRAVSSGHPGRSQGKLLSWIPSVVSTFILQRQHAVRAFRQIPHLEAPLAIGGPHKLRHVPSHNAVKSKGCWEDHHTHVRHTRTIKCIHHAPSNGEGVKFWTRRKGVDQSLCRVALIHIHDALPKLPHVRRVCRQRLLPSHFDFLAANHQIHRAIEWRTHKQFSAPLPCPDILVKHQGDAVGRDICRSDGRCGDQQLWRRFVFGAARRHAHLCARHENQQRCTCTPPYDH